MSGKKMKIYLQLRVLNLLKKKTSNNIIYQPFSSVELGLGENIRTKIPATYSSASSSDKPLLIKILSGVCFYSLGNRIAFYYGKLVESRGYQISLEVSIYQNES